MTRACARVCTLAIASASTCCSPASWSWSSCWHAPKRSAARCVCGWMVVLARMGTWRGYWGVAINCWPRGFPAAVPLDGGKPSLTGRRSNQSAVGSLCHPSNCTFAVRRAPSPVAGWIQAARSSTASTSSLTSSGRLPSWRSYTTCAAASKPTSARTSKGCSSRTAASAAGKRRRRSPCSMIWRTTSWSCCAGRCWLTRPWPIMVFTA